jgi:hypothetical protein
LVQCAMTAVGYDQRLKRGLLFVAFSGNELD